VSRWHPKQRADLDPDGQHAWDAIVGARGDAAVDRRGYLVGPFGPWMHNPRMAAALVDAGTSIRGSGLDVGLTELAIVVVAAHWRADFQWWFHSPLALQHGLSAEQLAAIRRRRVPAFARDDQATVHAVVAELLRSGQVADDVFACAVTAIGEPGIVALVALCGYYSTVSFTLNAFGVDVPPGHEIRWDE
jgi:4-carboxymuconolactone decarboxylase